MVETSVQEKNKEILRRVADEMFNRRNEAIIDAYYSPDYVQHNPMAPPGPAGVKQFFRLVFAAFPDLKVSVDHLYAEGDKVFAFMIWEGTHEGPYFGIPPSHRKIRYKTAEIMRLVDGKMVEHWDVVDSNPILEAAGLLPQAGPPPGH